MSFLAKSLKTDLMNLATELNLNVKSDMKVIELRNLIINDKGYDEEFTKELLNTIMQQRKEEKEEQRRKEEKEEQQKKEEQRRKEEKEEERRKEEKEEERRNKEMEYELRKLELTIKINKGRLQREADDRFKFGLPNLSSKLSSKEADICLWNSTENKAVFLNHEVMNVVRTREQNRKISDEKNYSPFLEEIFENEETESEKDMLPKLTEEDTLIKNLIGIETKSFIEAEHKSNEFSKLIQEIARKKIKDIVENDEEEENFQMKKESDGFRKEGDYLPNKIIESEDLQVPLLEANALPSQQNYILKYRTGNEASCNEELKITKFEKGEVNIIPSENEKQTETMTALNVAILGTLTEKNLESSWSGNIKIKRRPNLKQKRSQTIREEKKHRRKKKKK